MPPIGFSGSDDAPSTDELRPLLVVPAEPEPTQPAQGTVMQMLQHWCRLQPDKTLYTWLDDQGREHTSWSYRELEQRAYAVCHALLDDWGCRLGDRVILMYLPGLDFAAAFWGCLFAGVVAVPVYPVDLRNFEVGVERFGRIVTSCEPVLALSHKEYLWMKKMHWVKNVLLGSRSWPESLRFESTDSLRVRDQCIVDHQPRLENLALLQFTSGSTGDPKGVMISHVNLMHNVQAIITALGGCNEHIGVSWVPQYHDMGLIGVIMGGTCGGGTAVLMSPLSMLRDPLVWLKACDRHRAYHTCGMNGLYGHAVNRVSDQAAAALDLSSVMVYMSGGEPVRAETVLAFGNKFSVAGLHFGAVYPCFGMAENTVYVSGRGPELKDPRMLELHKVQLERGLVRTSESSSFNSTRTLVSCGVPGPGIGVKIVESETGMERLDTCVTEARIAIVGCGIAGLICALRLSQEGFCNIVMYERDPEVGGKVEEFEVEESFNAELGAAIFAPDTYSTIADAARVLGLSDAWGPSKMNPVTFDSISGDGSLTAVTECREYIQQVYDQAGLSCADAIHHPLHLEFSTSIGDWLRAKGLFPPPPKIYLFWTSMGYGYLEDDVPLCYFLHFIGHINSNWYAFKAGNQEFLRQFATKLQQLYNVQILKNHTVLSMGHSSGKTTVHTSARQPDDFDAVIVACPCLADLLPSSIRKTLSEFKMYRYVTAAVEVVRISNDQVQSKCELQSYHSAFLPSNCVQPEKTMGRVVLYGIRVNPCTNRKVVVTYQYASNDMSTECLYDLMSADLRTVGIEVGNVLRWKSWDYFPHFESNEIKRSMEHLREHQSQNSVFFTGSCMSFESTESVASDAAFLIKDTVIPYIRRRQTPSRALQLQSQNRVGEIWVSGPSKAQGYWGKPELSQQTFRVTIQGDTSGTKYLRTGDLGFMHQGELYVCGRIKDLIIVHGRTIYPQDIERSVEASHVGLRPGCSAAFSVEVSCDERLVVVAEVRGETTEHVQQQAIDNIQNTILAEHQLPCYAVLLLKERTVPKTTSGKIQRLACKQGYEDWVTEARQQRLVVVASKFPDPVEGSIEKKGNFVPVSVVDSIRPAQFVAKSALASQWLCQIIYNLAERPDLEIIDILNSLDLLISPGLSSLQLSTLQSQLSTASGVQVNWNAASLTRSWTVGMILENLEKAIRENNADCKVKPIIQAFKKSEQHAEPLKLPVALHRIVQFTGICAVVVLAAVALFPPYYFGQKVRYGSCDFASYYYGADWDACLWVQEPWSYFYLANVKGPVYAYGLLLPLVIIIWMAVFTTEVAIIKWIVIGRYREGILEMKSFGFLRWWFVDRVFDFWDRWVGYFICGTAWHTLLYKCLGLHIAWGSDPPLVREFDLTHIGASSDCENGMLCNSVIERGLVRLRPIHIGNGCTVKNSAIVMPGCSLCDHTIVEPHAVMLEGSIVTEPRVWKGNPATSDELSIYPDDWSPSTNVVLLVSKPMIMFLLLYVIFYCSTIQTLLFYHQYPLPSDWRYSELVFWSTTALYSGLMQCVSCIVLKWGLVGRLSPGDYTPSTWQKLRHWAVDFNGHLAWFLALRLIGDEAAYPNIWGMLCGSSISASSMMICWNMVPPSKADLFKVGSQSFVSAAQCIFEEKKSADTKTRSLVLIGDRSEVGYHAVLGPDVTVESDASVGLLTWVHHTVVEEGTSYFAEMIMRLHSDVQQSRSHAMACSLAFVAFFCRLIWIGMLVACLIPAYEFEMHVLYGEAAMANYKQWNGGIERYSAILLVSVSYLITTICIALLGVLMAFLVMSRASRLVTEGPRVPFLYLTMQITYVLIKEFLAILLNGTVVLVWLYRMMGAEMLADDTYINNVMQMEYNLLQVSPGCVINSASVTGHKYAKGQMTFDFNAIKDATEVRQGAVTWAGSITGPNVTLGSGSFQTVSLTPRFADTAENARVLLQGCPADNLSDREGPFGGGMVDEDELAAVLNSNASTPTTHESEAPSTYKST